ncbi:FAD/NAD(P)-binding protein [Paraneptunicella aestuarii]|uniref:FAD/NAD(P)-binding protein n=1 Tax=Paraneptunicella aestuarii TaxID=2831148 RepID=UPI001E3432EA|nr:FAD/NAD(P)-binding protein [Paraneptunicella aestuarii]UAA40589.1 FAD/NAD(P)-binding protein [Paraneptunicella aestuarii]
MSVVLHTDHMVHLPKVASFVPVPARLIKKDQESDGLYTLHLEICSQQPEHIQQFARFQFGQFNMLSIMGIGEIPISIMGWQDGLLMHTIRSVGRVSEALNNLQPGSQIGLRGPFGQGWPLTDFTGRDLIFITAGLGCAPVVAAINYAVAHKQQYRRIVILQGVKHHQDLLWQSKYDEWRDKGDCQVLLAASEENKRKYHWRLGLVTELLELAEFDPSHCSVMMCGPEIMMLAALKQLNKQQVDESEVYLSLERNFQCGLGSCGHCQLGPYFVCKDGPVFHYPQIKPWFGHTGF